ncbi:MAG: hypothetical protein GQ564_17400 [Bacteroidales bacterium]|nr:hypothetical protein [Bacteroidales bacterium]
MKKRAFILFLLMVTAGLINAQVPEKINYQAVIRNSTGELISSQDVGLKVSILNETSTGSVLYSEEHIAAANAYGQVAIEIGTGTNPSSDFSSIDWAVSDKFLKLEVDIDGGTSYIPIGTTQMLSVPYALFANNTDSARVAGMAYTASIADVLGSEGVYSTNSDTLFVVKDHSGNVVFAVFPDGAQVIVNESVKGKVGGFAVSGRSPSKSIDENILTVTADSTRIYITDTTAAKGKVGGFAVSGRSPSKGIATYFNVSGDNTPIIINPSESRVVWFPRKEAFWAGRVLIEHPDSVGFNSLAIGYEAMAKGNNSQSLGYQTRARGNFSTAIGFKTQANGVGCFAVGGEERGVDGTSTGVNTIADGTASFALGLGSNASGIANTAIGLRSSATGNFASTAFGVFASATANRATAIGFGSVASAEQALAIGVSDTASAYNSMAMGVGSRASGIAAIALGTFVEANTTGSFVVGQLNDPFGSTDLWNTSDPIFVVGNGIFGIPGVLSTALKSNALAILKNGNMGVGIDTPQRTVHIKDVMRLEPRLTAPLNPSAGDIYFDGSTNTLKVHNGTEWKTVSWTP